MSSFEDIVPVTLVSSAKDDTLADTLLSMTVYNENKEEDGAKIPGPTVNSFIVLNISKQ